MNLCLVLGETQKQNLVSRYFDVFLLVLFEDGGLDLVYDCVWFNAVG